MIFPEFWLLDLQRALDSLQQTDPEWGVLGCYGVTLDEGRGYIYSGGLGVMGKPTDRPGPVQTLDEIVLILRKSSGLRFDDRLPHFHFYGADICMTAAARGDVYKRQGLTFVRTCEARGGASDLSSNCPRGQ